MPSAKPAAVGGFVLGALIIVVAAILFFGGSEAFSSKTRAVVYFDGSVGGLGPGSPVTFPSLHWQTRRDSNIAPVMRRA